MQQMYKVFIYDKPVILSAYPDIILPFGEPELKFQINDSESIKQAFGLLVEANFKFSSVLLYNNESTKKLLHDFISAFKYLEAAGGVVMNSNKERLFIHRFGRWDLPKGKLEKGESPAEAALREVEEETGITGPTISYELPSSFHMYFHKDKWILKRNFWFAMQYIGNQPLIPQLEESIIRAEWINLKGMDAIFSNTYNSLLDLLNNDLEGRG
jgi:hypothetical protein